MQLNHCFPECSFTDYGPNCNTSCGEDCQHRTCNHTTGYCLACADDRFGNLCENELPAKGGHTVIKTRQRYVLICFFLMFYLMKKVLYI